MFSFYVDYLSIMGRPKMIKLWWIQEVKYLVLVEFHNPLKHCQLAPWIPIPISFLDSEIQRNCWISSGNFFIKWWRFIWKLLAGIKDSWLPWGSFHRESSKGSEFNVSIIAAVYHKLFSKVNECQPDYQIGV